MEKIKTELDYVIPEKVAEWYYNVHLAKYKFAAKYTEKKSVLDIACGSGYGSSLLSKNALEVVGCDINDGALLYANKNYKNKKLSFFKVDAENMFFENNSFDVIVSIETIEHLPNYVNFLNEVKRVLKEDGIFIGSTINKTIVDVMQGRPFWDKSPEIPSHIHEFSFNDISKTLNMFFGDVELYEQRSFSKNELFKRRCRILAHYFLKRNSKKLLVKKKCTAKSFENYDVEQIRYPYRNQPYSTVWVCEK